MLGLVGDVVPQLKLAKSQKVRFDTYVSKLHYRFTTIFLIICCILVTANDYIGKPIECIIKGGHGDAGQFGKAINTYCWISSTYTLPSQQEGKEVGRDVAHPGVGPGGDHSDGGRVFHAYYQWVPFVLFFQAILFYLPHFCWRIMESNTLRKLMDGLVGRSMEAKKTDDDDDEGEEEGDDASGDGDGEGNKNNQRKPRSEREKKIHAVAEYLGRSLHQHSYFYAGFIFCEVLSFIVVVGNIAFTDTFLGGEFSTYGTQVLQFANQDDEDRVDPMIRVFPRVTKCDWHHFGPSGTIQKLDALCILAVNIINEKIYIFLWFWFVILAVITGFRLAMRLVEACLPVYRKLQLRQAIKDKREEAYVDAIVSRMGIADWFIVREVKKHMNPVLYGKFLRTYARELGIVGSNILDEGSNKHGAGRGRDTPDGGSENRSAWIGAVQRKVKKGMAYV